MSDTGKESGVSETEQQEMDKEFMDLALAEARKAFGKGEVPIGAVVVRRGEVIARAHNLRETGKCATAHAELLAIQQACRAAGGWRLTETTLYVTIEPCPMCAGAIVQARISRVVFGAYDPKAGACGSLMNLLEDDRLNHRAVLQAGVREAECRALVQAFFNRLRGEKRPKGQ